MSIIRPFQGLRLCEKFISDKSNQSVTESLFKLDKSEILQALDSRMYVCDDMPSYYIYQQVNPKFSTTGLMALTPIEAVHDALVKAHEEVILEKLIITKESLEQEQVQINPVLLVYEDDITINKFIDEIINTLPSTVIISENETKHKFWVINNPEFIEKINLLYKAIHPIYIGDGHHRIAAISKLFVEQLDSLNWHKYFFTILVPKSKVVVKCYNRILHDLNKYDENEFIFLLQKNFFVTQINFMDNNLGKGNLNLYLRNKWYRLILKPGANINSESLDALSPFVIENFILKPLLGNIAQAYTDKISFIHEEINFYDYLLNNKEDKQIWSAIFSSPLAIDDIFRIADSNKKVPPNSTWILPKIPNGFINYQLTTKYSL